MLIAAPADSAIVQSDCDCACPAVPAAAASARPLHEHMCLRLHPQARFMELRSETNPHPPAAAPKRGEAENLLPFPASWGTSVAQGAGGLGEAGEAQFLLFIPSVLSGVVVSRELRDG